ncbi:serine hydrolase domain-containing protein [Taibaiella koreensis]|uniref:serine hydrolase domain-containing protein n=1 Tax=Taibaiella koreensis TaxID=1268548 RepID=UPI000E5A055F|nr:serine hydrolase [Taibaiella koreensis]
MKLLTRLCFLLLVSAGASCSKKTIEATQVCTTPSYPTHPKAASFQGVLDAYTQKGLPGIALLVRDSLGTWVGASGMADIEKGIIMQPCHISKVASITKIFMATLAFRLAEQGKLDIDAPVTSYLDEDQLKNIANAGQVTVRQLLNHTTGIYDVIKDNGFYLDVLNDPPRHRNQEDILQFVRGKKPAFPAGEGPGYSNTNTLLLSMIIDKIGGKPHQQLLHDEIIDRLQLKNTYYYYHDPLPEGKVAQGYYDLYNNGNIENLSSYNTGSGNGYTGLYSNVFDLLTFIDALLISKTLVSPGSLAQMLTFNPKEEEDSDRLLGPGVMKDFIHRSNNEYAYGHRGRDLAYSADLFYFPEKGQVMVLIVNYGTDGDSRLRPTFYDLRTAVIDAMMQ